MTRSEIQHAFLELQRYQTKTTDHCFCIFIDGLDEFQETPHFDYRDVLESLLGWTKSAPGAVKLCVSSREYNVFMNRLPATSRLRIHELTREDMTAFAVEKLSGYLDQDARKKIVNAIVEKASGIFLWVSLAITHIRDLLESDATISQLMQELDSLPDELYNLYIHILRSLSPGNRSRAYRALRMVEEGKSNPWTSWQSSSVSVTSLAYSFVECYEKDPRFAMSPDFPSPDLTDAVPEHRIKSAEKRLNGSCRGLIEVRQDGCIDYAHRSVAEFLQTRQSQDDSAIYLGNFQATDAISQLLLAELRFVQAVGYERSKLTTVVSRREMLPLVLHRAGRMLDHEPYDFLVALEAAVPPMAWDQLDTGAPPSRWYIGSQSGLRKICTYRTEPSDEKATPEYPIHSPLYLLASFGISDYPVWKMSNDPSCIDTLTKCILLAYTALTPDAVCMNSGKSAIIETLLEKRASWLHMKSPIWGNAWPPLYSALSFWHHCLMCMYIYSSFQGEFPYGKIMEAFLRQKPNLDFSMLTKPPDPSRSRRAVLIQSGKGDSECNIETDTPLVPFARSFNYPTLRVWIEKTNLENRSTLLELYDSQMKVQEEESELASSGKSKGRSDEAKVALTSTQPQGTSPSSFSNSYSLFHIAGTSLCD
jgi:hypothetical protein